MLSQVGQELLERGTVIYFKLRQVIQSGATLLQRGVGITKWGQLLQSRTL